MNNIAKEPLGFSYVFSRQETELMARLLRKVGTPDGLEKFRDTVLATLYNAMTIDEAESFFED